jgi:hypothetical protein
MTLPLHGVSSGQVTPPLRQESTTANKNYDKQTPSLLDSFQAGVPTQLRWRYGGAGLRRT